MRARTVIGYFGPHRETLGTGQIKDGHSIRAHPRHPGLLDPADNGFGGLLVNILLEDLARTVAIGPKEHSTAIARPSRRKIIALIECQPARWRQPGASRLQFTDVNIGLKIHL